MNEEDNVFDEDDALNSSCMRMQKKKVTSLRRRADAWA
jgi:hypothetical protein